DVPRGRRTEPSRVIRSDPQRMLAICDLVGVVRERVARRRGTGRDVAEVTAVLLADNALPVDIDLVRLDAVGTVAATDRDGLHAADPVARPQRAGRSGGRVGVVVDDDVASVQLEDRLVRVAAVATRCRVRAANFDPDLLRSAERNRLTDEVGAA